MLSISLDDDEAWEIGLTCGGTIEVFVERVEPNDETDAMSTAHQAARRSLGLDEAAVIVSPLDGASAALVVTESGARHGSLGSIVADDAAAAVAADVLRGTSRVETIGG